MLNNSKKGTICILLLAIIFIMVLSLGILKDRKENKANAAEYTASLEDKNQTENESEQQEQSVEDTNQEKDKDLYSKLKAKSSIKVLILGDGLALSQGSTSSEGHWDNGIGYYIENTFGSKTEIQNMAKAGSSSEVGLQTVNGQSLAGYDLIITCFGHNDNNSKTNIDKFKSNYSAIIDKIKADNPDGIIYTLLPNTLNADNTYRTKITEVSSEKGTTTVDLKKAFTDSGKETTYVTGTLPNNYGYQLYTQTIGQVLSNEAAK